jgi:hypothetical protein
MELYLKSLETRLDAIRKEYEKRKEYFRLDVETQLDTDSNFESNAISKLLVMHEYKTQIQELEYQISRLKLIQEVGE